MSKFALVGLIFMFVVYSITTGNIVGSGIGTLVILVAMKGATHGVHADTESN